MLDSALDSLPLFVPPLRRALSYFHIYRHSFLNSPVPSRVCHHFLISAKRRRLAQTPPFSTGDPIVRTQRHQPVSFAFRMFKYRAGWRTDVFHLARLHESRQFEIGVEASSSPPSTRCAPSRVASITFEREELRKNWHGIDWLDLLPLRGERSTTRKIRQIRFTARPRFPRRGHSLSHFRISILLQPAPAILNTAFAARVKFFRGTFSTERREPRLAFLRLVQSSSN